MCYKHESEDVGGAAMLLHWKKEEGYGHCSKWGGTVGVATDVWEQNL